MSIARLAAPARASTAYEHVRATLRAAVLDGTLPAGARLVQTELAAALGVSTTPVREALRDLAKEGLVLFDAHRGAVVRPLKIEEVREIYQLRMTLEPLMVARVIERLTDEQLESARTFCRAMEQEPDIGAWVNLNREFHAVFSECDTGSRLEGMLAELRDSAAGYVALSLDARSQQVEQANSEHGAMLAVYGDRNEAAAVVLTVEHLQSTLAAIEDAHAEGRL